MHDDLRGKFLPHFIQEPAPPTHAHVRETKAKSNLILEHVNPKCHNQISVVHSRRALRVDRSQEASRVLAFITNRIARLPKLSSLDEKAARSDSDVDTAYHCA